MFYISSVDLEHQMHAEDLARKGIFEMGEVINSDDREVEEIENIKLQIFERDSA